MGLRRLDQAGAGKQRRLTQQASLQRKLGQVARSLADIDAQTERLHRQLPPTPAGRRLCTAAHRGPRYTFREINRTEDEVG